MTKLQKCRRHYKWPSRLVIKFFMWAIYNSYVIKNFLKPNEIVGKRTHTFHMYVEKLCNELVAPQRQQMLSPQRHVNRGIDRLTNYGAHECERAPHATTNNLCVVCNEKYKKAKASHPQAAYHELPKKKKTVYWCNSCKVFLCIGSPGSNCWSDWHTKFEYWK